MGRVRRLDDSVINRIAAGEVVERPASVLKELVENSLDAGASSIEVRLEGGGSRRIEVRDDGCGMDREDALLAVERHATSKLSSARDLESIATLGFRGEALASIAAVSMLTLETSDGGSEGCEVEIHFGRIVDVRPCGPVRGTRVRVDRLFGSTPARRKFLKSEATELSHALRWMTRYALAHPERRFGVTHGTRTVLEAPPARDRRERLAQLYGHEFVERLLPFDLREARGAAAGFAGRPVDALPRGTAQHFFVNGRAVQDRVLAHAVNEAYGNTMPHGRHAAVFVFLELPPETVDVNVHPRKTEVRFLDSTAIHDLLRRAVRSSLADGAAVPQLRELRPSAAPTPAVELRESVLRYLSRAPAGPAPPSSGAGAAAPARGPVPTLVDSMQAADAEREHRRASAIAQYRESYILAEDPDGLLLVDQHAAHERVLFERYLADAATRRVETQQLMFPLTFDATPEELALLERDHDELARLGFGAEPFGPSSIRVEAVPALAAGADPESLFRGLLGEAARVRAVAAGSGELRRRLVTTAACHAAIKVNHPLAREAMQGLLDRLYATENPTTCPHGRPSLFRLTLDDIERAFRRR